MSAQSMLNAARSELGYRATSTVSKFTAWYGMRGYWCAMFVSWCAAVSGNGNVIPHAAYTPSAAAWFRARGEWHPGTAGLQPGDIVYFSFHHTRIDHTGIFEGWHRGLVCTIDGNTGTSGGRSGGCVLRRARSPRWVVGYGRPAYNTATGRAVGTGGKPGRLAIDGYFGPASTRALQHVMGTPADGIISGQDRVNAPHIRRLTSIAWGRGGSTVAKALQRRAGATPDGYIGPNTVRAIQTMTGTTPDSYFGPASAMALQRWVNQQL